MNTEQRILAMLNKTQKLREGKEVKLSLIEDAQSGMATVLESYNNGIWNSLEDLPNIISEILSEAKSVLDEAGKGQEIAILTARKVSDMAKELGINNPPEIDKIFNNSDYDALYDAFEEAKRKISSSVK